MSSEATSQQQQQDNDNNHNNNQQQQQEPILHKPTSDLEKALVHKQAGNDFVAQKEWSKACFQYKHIPMYLAQYCPTAASSSGGGKNDEGGDPMAALASAAGRKNVKPKSREQYEAIHATLYASYCNLALAHLNLNRPTNALQAAQKAVDLIPDGAGSAKGYYRRARARLALGMAEEAGEDFSKVLSLNPEDAASKAGLVDVKNAMAKAREKEAKMCAKMFA